MFHVLKSLMKGVTALMLVIGLAVRFVPATEAEVAVMGPDPSRNDLMVKRVAWAAMEIAPDFTVKSYSEALGVPEEHVREFLEATASGRPLAATGVEEPQTLPTGRRFEAGGALFVTADPDA